ncbi:MAG: phosphoribosylformylglycinamidine synthase subunit PurQ [Acidimicrobiia bacterium]|nr:phosphoribosylformylglycinamidine synthase subunit PurQ [Acidimicrobiia bacterium]NNL28450.1 phosphoribosylformylglycinamidine synthase subunit PurQ [Acidimicrobiia bacterium]
MRVAVAVFPGTNCEHDVAYALELQGAAPELVWHTSEDLSGFDGVVLPGGFAHGDYLRTGAIARFSPIMSEVSRLAQAGRPVLGICNGFQILCEARLLSGALMANRDTSFICRPIRVRVESTNSVLTAGASQGQVIQIPLNSYEGRFVAPGDDDLVVLRYCGPDGELDERFNPNGSTDSIAGTSNAAGNVVGLMPHPERAVEELLGSADGALLIGSFVTSLQPA